MPHGPSDRALWVSTLAQIAQPVLAALAQGKLRERMPVEAREGFQEERRRFTHLEAKAGIPSWAGSTAARHQNSALPSRCNWIGYGTG